MIITAGKPTYYVKGFFDLLSDFVELFSYVEQKIQFEFKVTRAGKAK